MLSKSDDYYKVQTDPTLNENRTSITQDKGEYNFDQYYAYINANSVYALNSVFNSDNSSKWVQDSQGRWYWYEGSKYVTGWKEINSAWYYFNSAGVMQTSQWIGNYYVGSDGKMLTSQWIGNCYVDASGLWQPNKWMNNGQWWYRYGDGSYPVAKFETGTAFPNFGNSEYVTGIRDNTRTAVVNFVFKRISDGKEEVKKPAKKK